MEDCISCGKKAMEGVTFPCPKCGTELKRCGRCRNLSIEYTCSKCGYVGP